MLTTAEQDFIFHHVFLPPRLPQVSDEDEAVTTLLTEVCEAANAFSENIAVHHRDSWARIAYNIKEWINVYNDGFAQECAIEDAISSMHVDDTLLFYVKCQNASILLRKQSDGTVFEAFEVQPTTDAVLAAPVALCRSFPARSVHVKKEAMQRTNFVRELANRIYKMSIEELPLSTEKSQKGSVLLTEVRQSENPLLVTQWLFAVLGSESLASGSTMTIAKRTRDEIRWEDTLLPWRRSPMWLSVRVAMQLFATRYFKDEGLSYYKNFMLFLLSRLTRQLIDRDLTLDGLQIMLVKLARRYAKLAEQTLPFVAQLVTNNIQFLKTSMRERWNLVTDEECATVSRVTHDTSANNFVLGSSFHTLRQIAAESQTSCNYVQTTFSPSPAARGNLQFNSVPDFSRLAANPSESLFSMLAIEQWVAEYLPDWTDKEIGTEKDCTRLNSLIIGYFNLAKVKYHDIPEKLSLMILNLIELWIAIDKVAVKTMPLLVDYMPPLVLKLFSPLMLHQHQYLRRLNQIEAYLTTRKHHARHSVFDKIGPDSFGVRFFHRSPTLKATKREIEAEAQEERIERQKEYNQLYAQKIQLLIDAARLEHDLHWPSANGTYDTRSCRKCQIVRRANKLEIEKHEWPLPANVSLACAAVFELQPPEAYVAWRDALWMLLQDVIWVSYKSGKPVEGTLLDYGPLTKYARHRQRRLVYASPVKSMERSHYKVQGLSLGAIYVEHCMRYELYDNQKRAWTKEQDHPWSLERYCFLKIPYGAHRLLGNTINHAGMEQNAVIAEISKCPAELSVHEFITIGSLRIGGHLQWMNLLTALLSRQVSFNSDLLFAIMEKLTLQVGPRKTNQVSVAIREFQQDFLTPTFSVALAEAVSSRIDNIGANWKELDTARVMLLIVQRMLVLSTTTQSMSDALNMLRQLRGIGLKWIRRLTADSNESTAPSSAQDTLDCMEQRLLNVALFVRATWDVDTVHKMELFKLDTDIGDYMECSICKHDTDNRLGQIRPTKIADLLYRDKILAAELEPVLTRLVLSRNSTFTLAMKRLLQDAHFHYKWQCLTATDGTWITNKSGQSFVDVQYNLVSGKLLVGGKPLSLLPSEYIKHAIYREIFGPHTIKVMTSDVTEMEYKVTTFSNNHAIYLGLRGGRLLIRSRVNTVWYEAIPLSVFDDDLPPLLIANRVAWMNLESYTISFRPRKNTWSVSQNDTCPTLIFDMSSPSACSLQKASRLYISSESILGCTIAQVFVNFEKPCFIHISQNLESGRVEIELPRYQLNFFVNSDGLIQCRELSSFVSLSQSLGTWHGLKSRLIMSSLNGAQDSVLVPYGPAIINRKISHTVVTIDTGDTFPVSYFQYRVDRLLGRLATNDDIDAHLFQAYLHALTGSPMRDALTSQTGTTTAISLLRNSVTRTNVPLSLQAQDILSCIAHLTPSRFYYPTDKKVMEQVRWHAWLPQLSQHNYFFSTVKEIATHNQQSIELFPGSNVSIPRYDGNELLLARATHQSERYYGGEAVIPLERSNKDVLYKSRDLESSSHYLETFKVADLVGRWPSTLDTDHNIFQLLSGWKEVEGFHRPFQAQTLSDLLQLNIATAWPSLYRLCVQSSREDQESLRFDLSLMVFGNSQIFQHVPSLLAFAISPLLKELPGPEHDFYSLATGHVPNHKIITAQIKSTEIVFEPKLPSNFQVLENKTERKELNAENKRAHIQHERQCAIQANIIGAAAMSCWPADDVTLPAQREITKYRYEDLQIALNSSFRTWNANRKFRECWEKYEEILFNMKSIPLISPVPDTRCMVNSVTYNGRNFRVPSLLSLLQQSKKPSDAAHPGLQVLKPNTVDSDTAELQTHRLAVTQDERNIAVDSHCAVENIVHKFEASNDLVDVDYAMFISESLDALRMKADYSRGRFSALSLERLNELYDQALCNLQTFLIEFRRVTTPQNEAHHGLEQAELWPNITTLTLLELLSIQQRSAVPGLWLEYLIGFAQAITAVQRIIRLQKFLKQSDTFALTRELENDAHGAWKPIDFPDWILIEIQNDMLIRPVQVRVAEEIMKDENGVICLGMGEGKSSVILPMVVTAMAHGSKLIRVIVLKSLASEMLRGLSQSLAGLVGRRVYHLPFSRHTKLEAHTPNLLLDMYKECRASSGVLLALPEHLNSFRLIGNDRLSVTSQEALAKKLLSIQKWLDTHARDILDECDELLKPGYELVYTNGEAKLLQGTPHRWIVVLEVLSLVQHHALEIRRKLPHAIELEQDAEGNSFYVRIVASEGYEALEACLLNSIMQGKLHGLPLQNCGPKLRPALWDFISREQVSEANNKLIIGYYEGSVVMDNMFLVRGLFAKGILKAALFKRHSVNYGLDRSRCLSAVPYRAKSTPSAAAEYAQPEMMILLTAISFYHVGLTQEDTRSALIRLYKSPDPADQYANWTSQTSTPKDLCSFSSVNIDDHMCMKSLHKHLRLNKRVINFFLANIVFPKEAKDFPYKLSTSAWDLCARMNQNITTGFSGTRDALLPLSMPPKDLADLRHTSASVLCALLRPENQSYIHTVAEDGTRLTPGPVLSLIVNHRQKPSVIIDVGAQFLASNHDVAQKWLAMRPDKEVAVYFNDRDQKIVLDRRGHLLPWTSSPFRDQPNKCLIFLDEFHSRGVDFALPDAFAAAVLLGPRLQKDTLVQACMRMRKLGYTQSVIFFAPPEVHNSICDANLMRNNLTSKEVLVWAISNSCASIKSQKPSWLMKGLAHAQRKHAFASHIGEDGAIVRKLPYLKKLREIESRPLSELYSAKPALNRMTYEFNHNEQSEQVTAALLRTWNDMDATVIRDRGLDEEQEREVLHEVEQERQLQRPRNMKPHVTEINQALWSRIRGENADLKEAGLVSCFSIFERTSLEKVRIPGKFPSSVIMTMSYKDTIVRSFQAPMDDFLRPVQWVLKLKDNQSLFLISPEEANSYMPDIRTSKAAVLFPYSARTVKAMTSFDKFDVYMVPEQTQKIHLDSDVVATLRLFAGQLYFNDMGEYTAFCNLLGLWDGRKVLRDEKRNVAADHFVSYYCRKANDWKCDFKKSPVKFLHQWINMRRHGIEWGHTHVGRVLNGQFLNEADFE